MLRHPDYTRDRIRQLVHRLGGQVYARSVPVGDLLVAGPVDRITYPQAQNLTGFRAASVGDQFRPTWATFWFRGRAVVPSDWKGQRVDLLWDSQSEATLWVGGRVLQGLNMTQGDRPEAVLLERAEGGETLEFQIEMACNKKFGAADGEGRSGAMQALSPYHLRRCDLAAFDPQAWEMYWDAYVLAKLENELAKDRDASDHSWAGLLLYQLNRFCNTLDLDDRSTWPAAHDILRSLYHHKPADRTFNLSVIGHAHIDTAWLWPLAETHRKCERTFASQSAYMRDYPEYRFACSQAYQYQAIKDRNPDLYQRILQRVRTGQWVPVGGTWIEPDCNIPSGEALCRQFLWGQRYFQAEFGIRCKEFWNPDVFGYNGQLPQIMRQAGVARFLTQKLSWNRFNKPHHHTFTWRGIDGSEVLTHFPPADTYNAMDHGPAHDEITWLRRNVRDYRDHDRSHEGIMLYGFGDGGGGPTPRMLEILRRARNLQGLPRTEQRTSDEFFDRLEKDATDLPVMWGELYFEYHRGTYTSQALVKKNNRRGERMLHDAEVLCVASSLAGPGDYPRAELEAIWKLVLLNQFHDILPGSSITQVYTDSAAQYEEVFRRGSALIHAATAGGDTPINTLALDRREVVERDGKLRFVRAEPLAPARDDTPTVPVGLRQTHDRLLLENDRLRAEFDRGGRLLSLIEKTTGREALAGPANLFELYDDRPTNYDAWDVDPFHLETRRHCPPAEGGRIARHDPLRAEIAFTHHLGKRSRFEVVARLDAHSPRLEFHLAGDWQESKTMLKVAFPVNVLAMNATYEMQFGHVERPTHYNTPYDLARFEVPLHKWFDLSEHGFGVAVLSDCKYGGSTLGNVMRLSLLRSPTSPDPRCDRGPHAFAYALMPHAHGWREAGVVAEAYRFNSPMPFGKPPMTRSLARSDDPNLVIDTIKKAEDSEAVVLRMYECHGARGTARVRLGFPVRSATFCNVLEDDLGPATLHDGELELPYRPHQIIGVKLVTA